MATTDTENLAQLIEQLRELVLRPRELITAGDMTGLMRLLASKSHLVDLLRRIEVGLHPYRDEDPEARIWSGPEKRRDCAEKAKVANQLLEEVMQIERSCERDLTVRRDEAAEQLEGAHLAARARTAYTSGDQRSHSSIDLSTDK